MKPKPIPDAPPPIRDGWRQAAVADTASMESPARTKKRSLPSHASSKTPAG